MCSRFFTPFLFVFVNCLDLVAQKEDHNWYFGNMAAINFSTNPPNVLTNSAMFAGEACATISDGNGNLLFYTESEKIFNRNHVIMANGSGLSGGNSTTQGALIVKKPGSLTQYYVFTLMSDVTGGLYYSEVDMSLAAGMGSVTAKNVPVYTGICVEKLTAVRHSNCTDIWIITHDFNSNNFRANLATASGVTSGGTVTPIGPVHDWSTGYSGAMKSSPGGKKLALAISFNPNTSVNPNKVELYDFNNTNGVVSNSLSMVIVYGNPYGLEFSPDGSKLYASVVNSVGGPALFQYNLCAGSASAIAASEFTVTSVNGPNAMQMAPNGKIYISMFSNSLAAVNSPNSLGAACNFTDFALSLSTGTCANSMPNFFGLPGLPNPSLTSNLNCAGNGTFNANNISNLAITPCSSSGYSASSVSWNFGDPSSGSNNNSAGLNATHLFNVPGTYTVSMVVNYSCSAMSSTIAIPVTVSKCVGLQDNEDKGYGRLFPNPFDRDLYFEVDKVTLLVIYNANGEIVFQKNLVAGTHIIDSSQFRPGMYVVCMLNDVSTEARRLVKIN